MSTKQKIVPEVPTITLRQCEKIINKKIKNNNYKIIDYKLLNLEEKCGFLGEHFRLIITVTDTNNKSENVYCFAKYMPNTQAQIDFVVTTGAFKKEVFVYEELFPKFDEFKITCLQSFIPECYYAKQDYVLVFEDITKFGYKPMDKYQFLDMNHVIIVLKAMVKLHASSLILEEKCSEKLNYKYKIINEYENYLYETFFLNEEHHKGGEGVYAAIKGLQAEADIFLKHKSEKEEFKKWLEIAGLDLFEKVKPSKKYKNVLCHGDLWNTNIMIKYEENMPQKCMLFDFQTMRYCPPAHDFMSFVNLTTSRNFRNQHLQNLQKMYYNELEEILSSNGYNLKVLITYEEFIESCKDQKRFAAVMTATYVQLTQIKNEFILDFLQDNEKWDEAMYKDRSLMVNIYCERDPEYRKNLQETIETLWDIFEET